MNKQWNCTRPPLSDTEFSGHIQDVPLIDLGLFFLNHIFIFVHSLFFFGLFNEEYEIKLSHNCFLLILLNLQSWVSSTVSQALQRGMWGILDKTRLSSLEMVAQAL